MLYMQSVADADEKITDSGYEFLRTKAAPVFQISGSGSDLKKKLGSDHLISVNRCEEKTSRLTRIIQ